MKNNNTAIFENYVRRTLHFAVTSRWPDTSNSRADESGLGWPGKLFFMRFGYIFLIAYFGRNNSTDFYDFFLSFCQNSVLNISRYLKKCFAYTRKYK